MTTSTPPTPDVPSSDGGAPLLVNLEQMAGVLRISIPTMRALARKYPQMPVVQPGSNGTPWKFDAEAVKAFVAATREAEAAAGAARDELLAQIALPLEETVPPDQRAITPQDRHRLAQAMLKEDELAKQRGFLVQTSDMRVRLTEIWVPLMQFLRAMPAALGARHNLPAGVVQDMQRQIDQQLRVQVAKLQDLLPAEAGPPEEEADVRPA